MKHNIFLLAVLLCFSATAAQGAQAVKAPAFNGKDLQGKTVSTSRFLGRQPALFMFWATW